MKKFTLVLFVTYVTSGVFSQNKIDITAKYGLRTKAVSAVYKLPHNNAVEGMYSMSHNNNRVLLTGLYEEFFKIGNNGRLNWFIGAGLHGGFVRVHTKEKYEELKFGEVIEIKTRDVISKEYLSGADMIGGMNYYIPALKMVVGIDIKPSVDFINAYSILLDGNIRLGIAL